MIDRCLAQAVKLDRRNLGMRGAMSVVILLSLAASAAAEGSKLQDIEKNVQSCNRIADVSPDDRIRSCSALIESGSQTPRTLAIAYNNRGGAYYRKGDYDIAIEDYD
jgi:tetratricopeptide (TPR) repeat protein